MRNTAKHHALFKRGIEYWNAWRRDDLETLPDLRGIDLSGADLRKANLLYVNFDQANLSRANFSDSLLLETQFRRAHLEETDFRGADLGGANFSQARLYKAKLSGAHMPRTVLTEAYLHEADLTKATLPGAILSGAILTGANLAGADLVEANLYRTNLEGAKLREASLARAQLVETNLRNADITSSVVYGISAWELNLEGTVQSSLIITPPEKSTITVDNLEVAQFIYMLLNHKKIRDVIQTVAEKAVLILGRFTSDRKQILDAIAERLRELKYLPVIFDFDKISGQDYTETVLTLAGLSRFIIADITQPKSVPQEAQAIIPNFKKPFVRLIQEGEQPWSMSSDLNSYDWALGVFSYKSKSDLVENLVKVVKVAEEKYRELLLQKAIEIVKATPVDELPD